MRYLRHLAGLCLLGLASPVWAKETPWHFVTQHFPPYVHVHEGVVTGAVPDLITEICLALKQPCQIVGLPWRRAQQMMGQGLVEGIFVVAETTQRRQDYHLTPLHLTARHSFYALREDTLRYRTPDDLQHRTVGVYGPSGTLNTLQELVGERPVSISVELDNLVALRKLASGRYGQDGLALVNEAVASQLIEQHRFHNLRHAGVAKHIDYYIGLSRRRLSPEMRLRFEQEIERRCRSGQLEKHFQRYHLQITIQKGQPCPVPQLQPG